MDTNVETLDTEESAEATPEAKVLKFRVTCSRAGDKHSFSSNDAARDFGGAVQEFFMWKADMTKFDVEVILLESPDVKYIPGPAEQHFSTPTFNIIYKCTTCTCLQAMAARHHSHFRPAHVSDFTFLWSCTGNRVV